MKKCRCATCGKRFETLKAKVEHKKKYPNKSCINIEVKGGKETNMVFGKKKKEKVAQPPKEDLGEIEEEVEEEVEEESSEEEEEVQGDSKEVLRLKNKIKELEKKKESLKQSEVKEETPEEPQEEITELTEEQATKILQTHEARLQRIEYHLRI